MTTSRKSAPCPNCCPAPGMSYFEPTYDYGSDDYKSHPIWKCTNCAYSTPRKVQAKRAAPADATFDSIDAAATVLAPIQVRAMRRLVERVAEFHGGRYDPDGHEFKRIEVKVYHGLVFLITEYGMKNDEGTMASVLCRDHRHVMVGERGQLRLMNAKRRGRVTGLFDCANSLTK